MKDFRMGPNGGSLAWLPFFISADYLNNERGSIYKIALGYKTIS